MSANASALYSQQYTDAVELAAQQTMAMLAPLCTPVSVTGKAATVVNLVDAIEVDERTTRLDDITFKDPNHRRPWVFPHTYDAAVPFDDLDAVRTNANPTSEYVQALVAAMNRKHDSAVATAFFADRIISTASGGDNVTDSFAAGQQVGVNVGGTASGLNVEKLQEGIRLFRVNEVDLDQEQLCVALSPRQEKDLANEIEVISTDFFGGYFRTRSLDGFLKIRFIVTNRLPTDGSSYRRVPMWTKRGMAFATWKGTRIDVSQRKDKRGLPWQGYIDGSFDAVRRDEKRVVEIKCSEA